MGYRWDGRTNGRSAGRLGEWEAANSAKVKPLSSTSIPDKDERGKPSRGWSTTLLDIRTKITVIGCGTRKVRDCIFLLSHLAWALRPGHPCKHVGPQLMVVRVSLVDELQPLRELDLSGGRSRGPVPVGANLKHLDLLLVILANVEDHLAKGGFQCIDRTLLLVGTAVLLVSEVREPC